MARGKAKRAYFPDEEPELETINYDYNGYNEKTCGWCGNTGHDQKTCYERPLSDWIQP